MFFISTTILALPVLLPRPILPHIIGPIDKYIPSVSAYLSCSVSLLCTQAGTCAQAGGKKKPSVCLANVALCPSPAASQVGREAGSAGPSDRCSTVN